MKTKYTDNTFHMTSLQLVYHRQFSHEDNLVSDSHEAEEREKEEEERRSRGREKGEDMSDRWEIKMRNKDDCKY